MYFKIAKVDFTTEKLLISPNANTVKFQTVFYIPLTLYYHKPTNTYLEKTLKIHVTGFLNTEKILIGKLKLDINSLINSKVPLFDPMKEILDDNKGPTGVFISYEATLDFPGLKPNQPTLENIKRQSSEGRKPDKKDILDNSFHSKNDQALKSNSFASCKLISSRFIK